MSQTPELRPSSPSHRAAQEIETHAGEALTREYWMRTVKTPLGEISRRSVIITLGGAFAFIGLVLILFWGAITALPNPDALPTTDALTVGTHIYANFSGNKSNDLVLFFPAPNELWRFTDAYTFTWADAQGNFQQVVIAEYGKESDLLADYGYLTRAFDTSQQDQAIYLSQDMLIEQRDLHAYGGQWRGMRLGNMMLLMSSTVNRRDQQELYSHFISIIGANQRDVIPTPTAFN